MPSAGRVGLAGGMLNRCQGVRRVCASEAGGDARITGRRLGAGEPEACGSILPRSTAAIFCESIVSFVALPPWMAFIESACPRTKGLPSSAQRAASQYQVHILRPPQTSLVVRGKSFQEDSRVGSACSRCTTPRRPGRGCRCPWCGRVGRCRRTMGAGGCRSA